MPCVEGCDHGRRQPAGVPHQLRLRTISVKSRMVEIRGLARVRPLIACVDLLRNLPNVEELPIGRSVPAEHREHVFHVLPSHRLIERDPDRTVFEISEVDSARRCPIVDLLRAEADRLDANRIEEVAVPHAVSRSAETAGQHLGPSVDRCRDSAKPLRPVVHGVHRGENDRQDLRSADVGGGLASADVLLARL